MRTTEKEGGEVETRAGGARGCRGGRRRQWTLFIADRLQLASQKGQDNRAATNKNANATRGADPGYRMQSSSRSSTNRSGSISYRKALTMREYQTVLSTAK